jgi:hypothetical protein
MTSLISLTESDLLFIHCYYTNPKSMLRRHFGDVALG